MPWPCQTKNLAGASRSCARHRLGGSGDDPRRSRGLRLVALLLLLVTSGGVDPATAQQEQAATVNGPASPAFAVGRIELVYARPHPDQPEPEELLPVEVELRPTPQGWAAPREGERDGTGETETLSIGGPESPVVRLEASGLARVLRAIVARIHELGLYGIDVRPSEEDIDLASERDLRPPDRSALEVIVRVGRIDQVRTLAVGDRITGDWKIDHELHAGIRRDSPLRPAPSAGEDSTELVDRRALEDYLFRLNRHSGRRVEAALSPAAEPGDVVLDYRVLESRPWYLYAQAANTGTRRTTPWQTRLGAVHRQLTNRDDVLSIEYLNADLEAVNSINARYQAPFFGSERPDWMNRRAGDPAWIRWLPRERIPWWGVDRLRWEIEVGYGRFEADDSPTFAGLVNDDVISEQIQYGGRFIYETFQHRDFFVDLWGGLRLRDVQVDNETIPGRTPEQLFVLPRAGIHAERINQISNLTFDASVEGSVGDTSRDEIERLGRQDADGRYAVVQFDLGYSTFLEPLLRPEAWRDPSTELSSTLAHEIAFGVRGQYAFDFRLVPQASQVIGGLFSVRGYDQSVAVGDTIVVGSLEYRFHLPRALPIRREPLRLPLLGDFRAAPQQVYGRPDWDLTLRAFVDAGRAIRNGSAISNPIEPDQTLIGAGVGAELQIRSNFRARIDWATALHDTSDRIAEPAEVGDQEVHVLFSILY